MGSLFTREPKPTQETEKRVTDYDFLLKLVIMGDFGLMIYFSFFIKLIEQLIKKDEIGVGKSTLLSRFVDGTFNDESSFLCWD